MPSSIHYNLLCRVQKCVWVVMLVSTPGKLFFACIYVRLHVHDLIPFKKTQSMRFSLILRQTN